MSDNFVLEVDDSKYTKEEYDHIFERLILIEPVKNTFQSEEYVSETGYALYAPIQWLQLLTGLEEGYLKTFRVIYRLTSVMCDQQVNSRGDRIAMPFEAV